MTATMVPIIVPISAGLGNESDVVSEEALFGQAIVSTGAFAGEETLLLNNVVVSAGAFAGVEALFVNSEVIARRSTLKLSP